MPLERSFVYCLQLKIFLSITSPDNRDPRLTPRLNLFQKEKLKGGDPAARSRTATLLRLSANHETHREPIYMGLRALPIFSA